MMGLPAVVKKFLKRALSHILRLKIHAPHVKIFTARSYERLELAEFCGSGGLLLSRPRRIRRGLFHGLSGDYINRLIGLRKIYIIGTRRRDTDGVYAEARLYTPNFISYP
jgi:hypothetical protein